MGLDVVFVGISSIVGMVRGSLMIAGAVTLLLERQEYKYFLDVGVVLPYILILLGVFPFLLLFLGCSDIRKNGDDANLRKYWIPLMILIPLQFGLIVGTIVDDGNFKREELPQALTTSIQKYDVFPAIQLKWDDIQLNLTCCGSHNYTDWKLRSAVPKSCCMVKASNCSENVLDDEEQAVKMIFVKGCADVLGDINKGRNILIAAAVVASIELIGLFLGIGYCCLMRWAFMHAVRH